MVTSGSPVRGHPVRLKGNDSRFVNEWITKQVEEGLCKRTKSSWGSWAFPTKASETRDPRIVLDYRKVNTRLVRSLYYIRRCEDLKTEAAGAVFYSALDGQKGYNLLEHTPYAKEV